MFLALTIVQVIAIVALFTYILTVIVLAVFNTSFFTLIFVIVISFYTLIAICRDRITVKFTIIFAIFNHW